MCATKAASSRFVEWLSLDAYIRLAEVIVTHLARPGLILAAAKIGAQLFGLALGLERHFTRATGWRQCRIGHGLIGIVRALVAWLKDKVWPHEC